MELEIVWKWFRIKYYCFLTNKMQMLLETKTNYSRCECFQRVNILFWKESFSFLQFLVIPSSQEDYCLGNELVQNCNSNR